MTNEISPEMKNAIAELEKQTGMRAVIFHRKEGFYPLELPLDHDLAAHAECNPGTLKITNAITGEVLWQLQ